MTIESREVVGSLDWLKSPRVIRSDGAVMSWVNPLHPGYPYPEIAGYMLSFLALEDPTSSDVRDRIALRLAHEGRDGGLGRAGINYVFDAAMVLSGLLAHQRVGGQFDAVTLDRIFEFIIDQLKRRQAVDRETPVDPTHWSVSYGCHLLKTIRTITAYDELRPDRRTRPVIDQLVEDLLPLADGGRFRVNALSQVTYTHSHCYAIEGLLALDGRGLAPVADFIEKGADWLASVQLPDGGLPSSHNGIEPTGMAHTDCTAQAIRIWSCVGVQRYRDEIDRGVRFLDSMAAEGGFRYRAGSDDINTWATIFAVQAINSSRDGGSWQWLV